MTKESFKNWKEFILSDVCNVFSGTSAPQGKEYFSSTGKPFIRVSDLAVSGRTNNLVSCRDRVSERAVEEKRLILARKGTVLFPKSGAAILNNNRALLGVDAYIVNHLAAITPGETVDSRFLFYLFCNIDMRQYIPNPSYPSLNLSTIKQMKVFLPTINGQPDIAEQKRIADKLDKLFAEIDKAIKNTQAALGDAEKILQSELQKIFNKTTTRNGNNINLEDESYFYIETGSTPKTTKKEYWDDGNVIWITPKDLGCISNQEIDDSERKITVQGLKNCSASLVPKGSIVISTRAPIGYVAVVGKELCFNQGCKAVVIRSEHILSKYLYYAILMAVDKMKESGKGSTFKEISKSKLGKISVLFPFKNGIPDIDKQSYIANKLDKIYVQSKQLREKYHEQLDCWLKLKQSLLNQAFRGEL